MDAYTRMFPCYIMLPNCPLSLAFSQCTLTNLFNRMVSLSAVQKKKRRNGSLDGNLDVKNEYDPMFKLWLVAANILNSHMVSESI